MPRSGDDTRNGLITAAKQLYHHQGYHRTTLADVAAASEIPLGSVYYHFRTKDALAQAVIHAHAEDIRRNFAEWGLLPDPRQRLKMLLASSAHYKGVFARYGCPYGTLAVELDKDDGDLIEPVGGLLQLYLTWVAKQYREMGAGDKLPKQRPCALSRRCRVRICWRMRCASLICWRPRRRNWPWRLMPLAINLRS